MLASTLLSVCCASLAPDGHLPRGQMASGILGGLRLDRAADMLGQIGYDPGLASDHGIAGERDGEGTLQATGGARGALVLAIVGVLVLGLARHRDRVGASGAQRALDRHG